MSKDPIVTSRVKRRLLRSTVSLQCRCFPFFAIEHLEERKRWSSTEASFGIKNSQINQLKLCHVPQRHPLCGESYPCGNMCVCNIRKRMCPLDACFLFYTTRTWSIYCFFCSSSTLGQFGFFRVCVAIGFKGSRNPSIVEKENVLLLRLDAKTMSMVCTMLFSTWFQLDICFPYFRCGTLASTTEPILLKWLKFGFMYVYQSTLTLICYTCS